MFDWKLFAAPLVFGFGYAASVYLLETTGTPDHAKFVRMALADYAAKMAQGYLI